MSYQSCVHRRQTDVLYSFMSSSELISAELISGFTETHAYFGSKRHRTQENVHSSKSAEDPVVNATAWK